MNEPQPTVKEEKIALREILRTRCAEAAKDMQSSSLAMVEQFTSSSDFLNARSAGCLLISAYAGYGTEIDPLPLMKEFSAQGHKFCLPCVLEKGKPLQFRAYDLGDPVRLGEYNIPEPLGSAPIVKPDIMLIPMLGFDRTGNRLGRGGGFYDRTLNAAREHREIIAIGVAYSAQEVPVVPCGKHDGKLDAIVTEKEYIKLS